MSAAQKGTIRVVPFLSCEENVARCRRRTSRTVTTTASLIFRDPTGERIFQFVLNQSQDNLALFNVDAVDADAHFLADGERPLFSPADQTVVFVIKAVVIICH